MNAASPAEPRFVTGADEKYFYMCGILHESLRKFLPGFPLYVMDFGLSAGQRRILRENGMLLPLPAGLEAGMHPFRLKSSMDRYVSAMPGPWIWIDADMMAVRDSSAEVHTLCKGLRQDGARLAMARDMGPDRTLGSFSRRYETPRLRTRLLADPQLDAAPYLNSGIVFFPDNTPLPGWRALAAELEPDVLWEQNALNLIAHGAANACRILDSRKWNAQASLLDGIVFDADGIRCAGEQANFLHATSSTQHHLAEFRFSARLDGQSQPGYARLFTRPELREMQTALLAQFLQRHPSLTPG